MFKKRAVVILVITLMIGFLGLTNQTIVESNTGQKIELAIYKLSWSVYFTPKDTTTFQFVTNVTIYNPNDQPVNLTFPTIPLQIIGTNATIDLDDPVETTFNSICASNQIEPYTQEIPPGYSTNASISFLNVDGADLTELPDGSYLFESNFYAHNQTVFSSQKTLLIMDNGTATISYNYGAVSNPASLVVLPIFTIACSVISLIFSKRRKKGH